MTDAPLFNHPEWPSARAHTLKSIDIELRDARKDFPTNEFLLATLARMVGELNAELVMWQRSKNEGFKRKRPNGKPVQAIAIQMAAIRVAAMAIRVCEEGDHGFAYGDYLRATGEGPLFERPRDVYDDGGPGMPVSAFEIAKQCPHCMAVYTGIHTCPRDGHGG